MVTRSRFRVVTTVPSVLVILALLYLVFKPVGVAESRDAWRPTQSYEEAIARYEQLAEDERAATELSPICHSKLMTHRSRADRVIVLLHGFTNCPQQLAQLGQELFDRGYNVFIPRMPRHGETDREQNSLSRLTAQELVAYGNQAVDIASGLGTDVTVFGISGGGTVAAWAAQNRPEVDLGAVCSVYLGLAQVPAMLTPAVANLGELLPPIGFGPGASAAIALGTYAPYSYFNNDTRATTSFLHVSLATMAQARQSAPAARRTLMIVNDADETVNLDMIRQLDEIWTGQSPSAHRAYHFDQALKLPHDVVGPDRVDQRVELVYPILLELLTAPQS